ncbi:MAG: phosphatidate cytidylyltransferase [Lysobacteraceae bacterium]
MSRQRTITAAVLAPFAIAALLLLPTPWLAVIATILFLMGLWEWTRLVGIEDSVPRAMYLLVNLCLIAVLAWSPRVLLQVIALIGVCWWLLALLWLARPQLGRSDAGWARSLKLAVGTLCVVPAWCGLVLLHGGNKLDGILQMNWGMTLDHRWALVAVAMVWVADSGAYTIGSRFGRRKLIPLVSPNKTWAGLMGGLTFGVAFVLLASPWLGVGMGALPQLAALALLGVLASVDGDLLESLMKRQAGVKDSGDVFPGHGGVLDRVDSLLAALPVMAIGKEVLGL